MKRSEVIKENDFYNPPAFDTFAQGRFERIVEEMERLNPKIIALEGYEPLQYLPEREFNELSLLTKIRVWNLIEYRQRRKTLQCILNEI